MESELAPAEVAVVESGNSSTKNDSRVAASDQRTSRDETQITDALLVASSPLASAQSSAAVANSGQVIALDAAQHGSHHAQALAGASDGHAEHAGAATSVPAGAAAPAGRHGHSDPMPDPLHSAQFAYRQADPLALQVELGSHPHHGDDATSSAVTQKFAPKRCTVRYTSKEVYRDTAGERKCDCPQKAAAEAAARHSEAIGEVVTNPVVLLSSSPLLDCLPCQFDFDASGGACGLPGPVKHELSIDEPCAAERPRDGAWARGVTSFYEGLQIVGWTLAGTGVVAAAIGRKRTEQAAKSPDSSRARDRFFGALGLEMLPK